MNMARPLCPLCGQHRNICVCADCASVANQRRLLVLQHPSEVGHSKGTVRLLQQCLQHIEVLVGESPASFDAQGLDQRLQHQRTGLLFPGPDSQPLTAESARDIEQWLVLDGTWRKAARILYGNPPLATLPSFHFVDAPTSGYRIRKAPKAGQLSTAEAVAHLLSVTEPGLDTQPLLRAQQALVEKLLAFIPPEHR